MGGCTHRPEEQLPFLLEWAGIRLFRNRRACVFDVSKPLARFLQTSNCNLSHKG